MNINPVGWFEIYANDLERAKAFYQDVFQTELTRLPVEMDNLEMWAFPMTEDGTGCPGAIAKMEGVTAGAGGTLVYFSSEDCAAEADRVEAAGGKVIHPKFSIGEYGCITLVEDSEGNMIGIHSPV